MSISTPATRCMEELLNRNRLLNEWVASDKLSKRLRKMSGEACLASAVNPQSGILRIFFTLPSAYLHLLHFPAMSPTMRHSDTPCTPAGHCSGRYLYSGRG